MRPWKSRAGQIAIPAMLLFPTLFLFVYLIYETAKLSREKIKHQFAMDAAAFVEATNYSDFLNRTAYVNGAFPMRIFEQGYDDFPSECENKSPDCPNPPPMYSEMLYKNGIFPRSRSGKKEFSGTGSWDIEYGGAGVGKNSEITTPPHPGIPLNIEKPNKFWHPWDLATEVYKLYVQVYSLLGSVEDAQWQVLDRLTNKTQHSFLKKSYWLNTGDPAEDADKLAASWDNAMGTFKTTPYCVRKLIYHGNRHMGGTGIQQYRVFGTDPAVDLPQSAGCSGGGMFQMQTVDKATIKALSEPSGGMYPGLSLSMTWKLPGKNYFDVDFGNMPQDFKNGTPELHTTVSVGAKPTFASVWPDPTPKFQVRQFP
jgi:hypothetical protein